MINIFEANDCLDCDFRLVKVPAADHPPGSVRNLWGGRNYFPKFVGSGRGAPYEKKNLIPGLFDWQETTFYGSIPEVPHTYGYLDGTYAIQNEHQLSFGESTCGALLTAVPILDGGKAMFEMAELSRIAMERCITARCAIQLLGDLAVEHGFYGFEWKGPPFAVIGEGKREMGRE